MRCSPTQSDRNSSAANRLVQNLSDHVESGPFQLGLLNSMDLTPIEPDPKRSDFSAIEIMMWHVEQWTMNGQYHKSENGRSENRRFDIRPGGTVWKLTKTVKKR